MDRLACVDVPALPLQILLREHPAWGRAPAAVVDEDRPQGWILWVNEHARRLAIRPGQRYAQGLALSSELRAGTVPPAHINRCVADLTRSLRAFSPHVEPRAGDPGVFWLCASGLLPLFASLETWADAVRAALARHTLDCGVVVGFRRFATYAVAKALGALSVQMGGPPGGTEAGLLLQRYGPPLRPPMPPQCGRAKPVHTASGAGCVVFADPAHEHEAACKVPLARLGLPPETRDALERLGCRTVGAFIRLPAAGVSLRFGPEAARLHELATGGVWDPLQPLAPDEPATCDLDLDEARADVESLLFFSKRLLDALLGRLAARGEALVELGLRLHFDGHGPLRPPARDERIRPAAPTLDAVSILGLVRLRLEATPLPAPVVRLVASALGVRAVPEQMRLLSPRPRRDPRAAAGAFARLRAAFGDDAVVRACLKHGHLPEARFVWEPLETLPEARPRVVGARPLVRRILGRPQPLPPRARYEWDGWLLAGLEQGPVERLSAPYRLSGGWWRKEIERDYHFAEMRSGACLWVYYDRRRRRWFLHGRVA